MSTQPYVKSHFIGMVMENCPQARPNHAELVIAHPSPVLIYQISSKDTRVLVDVKGGMPKDVKAYFNETVYPVLPGEFLYHLFLISSVSSSGAEILTELTLSFCRSFERCFS